MDFSVKHFNEIFKQAIEDYHVLDDVNQSINNPYTIGSLDHLLYRKCFIDSIQWHLEDIIRDPKIEPKYALEIKRRIDKLNQERTDTVEEIDEFIYNHFKNIPIQPNARVNTETPGWAIDRLSILNLKVYHWKEETERKDASENHIKKAKEKLKILQYQLEDLSYAISMLFEDLKSGRVIAKTYKQMKMYNDPELNPILRKYKSDE